MTERTFHQVMLTFRVPRDPPLKISCSEMIMDDPVYVTGSFEGFLIEDTDFAAWFLLSSAGPTIDDCPVSGGRMLRGIAHARKASKACLGSHVETLLAQVQDLEIFAVTRKGYM